MLSDLHLVAYGVLAVLAALVARRNRAHRPVAGYIGWMFASDIVRLALMRAYQDAPRPFHGLPRLAFHVDEAIALSWWGFFVAACLVVFVGRGARWALLVWLLLCASCLFYPWMSGKPLVDLYLATGVASAIASWACIGYGVFFRKDLSPGLPQLVLILYATTDVATYLFSHLQGLVKNWPIVRIANLLLLVACIVAHLTWLARARKPRTA